MNEQLLLLKNEKKRHKHTVLLLKKEIALSNQDLLGITAPLLTPLNQSLSSIFGNGRPKKKMNVKANQKEKDSRSDTSSDSRSDSSSGSEEEEEGNNHDGKAGKLPPQRKKKKTKAGAANNNNDKKKYERSRRNGILLAATSNRKSRVQKEQERRQEQEEKEKENEKGVSLEQALTDKSIHTRYVNAVWMIHVGCTCFITSSTDYNLKRHHLECFIRASVLIMLFLLLECNATHGQDSRLFF